jgi:acylphosphatase
VERDDLAARKGRPPQKAAAANAIQARRYIVSGRVQGVGYRNYAEHVAGKFGIDGYVRNRLDGSVEVFAIGAPESLKQLLFALEKGPMLSHVSNVREEPAEPDEKYFGNFIIEITI